MPSKTLANAKVTSQERLARLESAEFYREVLAELRPQVKRSLEIMGEALEFDLDGVVDEKEAQGRGRNSRMSMALQAQRIRLAAAGKVLMTARQFMGRLTGAAGESADAEAEPEDEEGVRELREGLS